MHLEHTSKLISRIHALKLFTFEDIDMAYINTRR